MKKRIITKRILVIAFTLITMFNSIPITAFASDDSGNEVISEEVSNNDDASDESGSDDSSDLLLKVAEDGNDDSNDQGGVPERFDSITSGVVPSSNGGEVQGDEINGGNGDDVVLPNADGGDDGEETGGFPAEVTPTYEPNMFTLNLEVKNDTGIVTNTTIGLYVFDQEKGSFKQVDGPVYEGAYLAINIDRDFSDKDLAYVLTVDGKEIVGDATYIYMPNHDVDVKLEIKSATPKFTVTFDYSEDHPDLISDSWKVEANETITLPDYWACNNDLTFSGWLIDGKLYKAWSSYTVTNDVTVVAKFNIKPLSININGQEIASDLLPGDTFTFPEFNGEITNGYIFDSYTYKGVKYKPGDTIVVSADTSASFIDIYVNYLKIVKCEVTSSDDQVAKNVRIFDEDGNELSTLVEGTQVKIYVDSDAPIESIKVNDSKFTGSNLYKEGDYTYVKYVIPYVETLTIDIKYMPLVTITFDTDGGEPLEPITGYKGETLKLPVPTKDGYLFRTWSNNGSSYETIILDKDLTFKANWYKLLNYTVSVTNDEDVTYEVYIGDYQRDERVEYVQEKSAYDIVVIVPNRDIVTNIDAKNVRNVKFQGMYNGYYYAELTTSNDDFEIIVEFKEKETLIFDTDGGSSVDPIKWYEDEPMILPLEPTKDGYEFLGWEIDGKTFDAGGDYVMHKSTTAKALWKLITYKITFDCNYPEASLVPNVNGKSGRYDITQIVPGSIFKMNLRNYEAGYVLTGLEMDGVAIEDNFRTEYTMPNHDVVVKVTFTKLIDIPYEVTTNMDIDFNYSMYTYPTLQEVTNGNITMNSNYCLALTFDERLFSIDNVTVDGTELKTYDKNDKTYYRLTAPISDKASIKVNFKFNQATITFDANGGNGTMNPISENIGTKVTLPDSTFTKTGYKFNGWTLDDKIVTEITLDDDVTVKASWKKVKEDTKPSNNNNDGNNSNNNNNNSNSNVTNDGTNKTNETTTISQLVVPVNNPVATQVNANNNVNVNANVNANQEVNEVTIEDEDVTVDNTTVTTESNVTTNTDGESNDGNTVVTNGNEGSNDDSDNGTFIEDNKTNDGMDKNTISTILTAFLAVAWPWILGSTVTLVGIGVAVKVVSIKKKGRR
ncbi:MAG: InlB B-repeat-containing protein [Clostridia bacterium]|nr:InlB B-repeat-containing protein [Clostridia bacterium]